MTARGLWVRRLAGFLLALVMASSALSASDQRPAAADDDGLRFESHSVYQLDAAADVVRVSVDVTVTNETPDPPSGRYFFHSIHLPVLAGAVELAATRSDGRALGVTVEPTELPWLTVAVVDLSPNIFHGESQTFRFSYVLRNLPARSEGLVRVNDAFTTFIAYALGDPGITSVEVLVPNDLIVEIVGDEMERSVRGTETAYTAAAIADPATWDVSVVARDEDALVAHSVVAAGHSIEVLAWPNDKEWGGYVADQVRRGLPVLEELIGQPWPSDGDGLEIIESVAPYAYGFGGWYSATQNAIEIGDLFDPHLILHELSHLWFNDRLFSSRWINEGLAEEFAAQTLAGLGEPLGQPNPVLPEDPGIVRLNAWTDPELQDETSRLREAYAYNASWSLLRSLSGEIGIDGLAAVIDAAANHHIPYQGDPEPEQVAGSDWRRFLDLLEEVGGSAQASTLFATSVVSESQAALLAERAEARLAYDAFAAASDGWTAPLAVREAMSAWTFDKAMDTMETAEEILDLRDRIADTVEPLGLEVPERLENDYESGEGLADVAELAGVDLDAARTLVAADDAVQADRGILETIGLWGSGVEGKLDTAEQAFEDGDQSGVVAAATRARDLVDDAAASGVRRLATVAGGLVALFGIFVVIRMLVRRRRRRPALAIDVAVGNLLTPTYPGVPPLRDDTGLAQWGPPATSWSPPADRADPFAPPNVRPESAEAQDPDVNRAVGRDADGGGNSGG